MHDPPSPAPIPPLYLAGPTGSGKTAVALELARILAPVEILNADAFQAYRGLEILSAAPSPEERALVPHHLFGILDPAEENDAAAFARLARAKIAEVGERALPLVVGGSGLYLKAITHGLAPTPKGDPALRVEFDALPLEELVARYRVLDPEGATRTDLNNRRYVARNLEICLLTGQPASALKSAWAEDEPDIRGVFLKRERENLNERISQRTVAMFAAGIVAEVAALGPLSTTAAKAIGLPEVRNLLAARLDEAECMDRIRIATRRYAKRQETWFRREAAFAKLPVARNDEPALTAERIVAELGLVALARA